jgi:AcrR family transcriptional regulator
MAAVVKEIGKKIGKKKEAEPIDKHNDSREKILEASFELFCEQGYEKTTIRQIIQRSGVLNGSLYYAFGNKEGIFRTIAMEAFEAVLKESEKELEKNSNLLVAISYPAALDLYLASKSKHIAEMLYHGHNSWQIMNGIMEVMRKWIDEQVRKIDKDFVFKDYDRNVLAIMGVIGKYIEEYYVTDNNIPFRKNLKEVIIVTCALFGQQVFDIDSVVEAVASHVEALDIMILGSKINSVS